MKTYFNNAPDEISTQLILSHSLDQSQVDLLNRHIDYSEDEQDDNVFINLELIYLNEVINQLKAWGFTEKVHPMQQEFFNLVDNYLKVDLLSMIHEMVDRGDITVDAMERMVKQQTK